MGPDESIDTHVAGSLSLKSRKNDKSGFSKKPDFPVRIRIRWYGNLRGVTLRSQGVRRSEKAKKNFRTKSGFFRIRISGSMPRLCNGASAFSSYMIQTVGPYKQTGLAQIGPIHPPPSFSCQQAILRPYRLNNVRKICRCPITTQYSG